MAMDVDYPNKGAFFHDRIAPEMAISGANIRSWEESPKARSRTISNPESGNIKAASLTKASGSNGTGSKPTLGLLAQISPDGKWLVGTINDKSIVMPKGELAYSQVFLPVQGILAAYNLQTGEIKPLPGADDPQYVQTNPAWSPARSRRVVPRPRWALVRVASASDVAREGPRCAPVGRWSRETRALGKDRDRRSHGHGSARAGIRAQAQRGTRSAIVRG